MNYKKAGVDTALGDACSSAAARAARKTFPSRTGIGKAVDLPGGFTGALDMGAFYMVQNEDTVGTKMMVAERIRKFDTLGADLTAMVADDAVCVGAEVVSITNTIMANHPSVAIIGTLMEGLAKVCKRQRIIIPGGEVAHLEHIDGYEWGATAVGIVEKKKFITGKNVRPGDAVIGIREFGLRSNGFTLARRILEKKYGKNYVLRPYEGSTWGKALLRPAIVYHDALLSILGRYGKKRLVNVKALAHITGGGIADNIGRILQGYGADLTDMPMPPKILRDLMTLGNVRLRDAMNAWNMGIGMTLIVAARDVQKTLQLLRKKGLSARQIGHVRKKSGISVRLMGEAVMT